MIYEAHLFEDRERVIKFDKDSDELAIAWADLQWERGLWSTTATGFELRRPNGDIVHGRERN